jgi:hypothetical protein
MKKLILLFFCALYFHTNAQVLCGTANENGTVTLTAPAGNAFSLVEFASYGTPTGTCGNFSLGGCNSSSSVSQVAAVFIGNNTGSIGANNAVFGDPCVGTPKRLYVQLRYSAVVPLVLTSFTAKKIADNKTRIDWTSTDEVNTLQFIIERSIDGLSFNTIGIVTAEGTGANAYQFTDNNTFSSSAYYRLKMVDKDGKFKYSNIVRVSSGTYPGSVTLYPNPASGVINVASDIVQPGFVTNTSGQVIKKVLLGSGTNTIDIQSLKSGFYFLRIGDKTFKVLKK